MSSAPGFTAAPTWNAALSPIGVPFASRPRFRLAMIVMRPTALTSQTAVAVGLSPTRGGSPRRAMTFLIPSAWAPISSDWIAMTFRSRHVKWAMASRPTCCWISAAQAMTPIRMRAMAESVTFA